jgi:hypothetical protein
MNQVVTVNFLILQGAGKLLESGLEFMRAMVFPVECTL